MCSVKFATGFASRTIKPATIKPTTIGLAEGFTQRTIKPTAIELTAVKPEMNEPAAIKLATFKFATGFTQRTIEPMTIEPTAIELAAVKSEMIRFAEVFTQRTIKSARIKLTAFKLTAVLTLFAFLLAPAPSFAAEAATATEIGTVISVTPGVFALRDGKKETLSLRSSVYKSDTIQTDATGKLRVLLNDESAISLGADTTIEMREYIDDGAKSAFNARLLKGVARVITGRITEMNPDGFSLNTAEVGVGIRGTIISVRRSAENRTTSVFVEHTARQVLVNNQDLPSGFKMDVMAGQTIGNIQPIQLQDRQNLRNDLAQQSSGGGGGALHLLTIPKLYLS